MANTRFKTHHGLNATANSYIDGKLEVTGDLVVSGNVSFSGSSVGDLKPDADQRNLGNTSLRWNLVGFAANLASTLTANGATSLSNTLLVTGAITFQNTLTLTGWVNTAANLVVGGSANVTGQLNVAGNSAVVGTTVGTGNVSFTDGLLTVNSGTGSTLTVGAANVSVDSGTLFIDAVNNRVGINNNAPGVSLRVTGATDISSTANVQGNANVGGSFGVAGVTTLAGNTTLSGALQTIAGNVNFDSGVLFVDSVNNRVGINNTAPTVALEVTGSANVTTSVNSPLLTVGTSFTANTTGAYHTGTVNAASYTTSGFVANATAIVPTSNTILLGNTTGRWVITANSVAANSLVVSGVSSSGNSTITGFANVSAGVNSSQFTAGSIGVGVDGFIANSTHISVGDTVNNVQITATGVTLSVADGLLPSSNILGNALGSVTQRWDLYASNGNFSGNVTISGNLTVTGTTTYINTTNLDVGDNTVTLNADLSGATAPTENAGLEINRGSAPDVSFLWNETSDSWTLGNTDITGYANASVSVNSALLTVGTSFIANTTGAYHTGTVNAASHTIGSTLIANTTGVYHTGTVNAAFHTIGTTLVANTTGVYHTGTVNAASLTVGTSLIANSLGVYHTGTVNAASFTTTGFVANTTAVVPTSNTILLGNTIGRWVLNANTGNFSGEVTLGTTLSANGSTGTAGQVLLSGGATNTYWGAAGISIVNDTTTNGTRYLLFNENTSGSRSNVGVSSTKLTFNPSSGILSTVEFTATSDERLKSDINTIPMALKRVSEMRGVNYVITESGKRSMGLIAQEIESIFPEVVNTDVDGYKSINYGSLVGVLVEAIKELKQEIEELKNGKS